MQVVGVDGCPRGWIAVVWDDTDGSWSSQVHASITEVLAAHDSAACIGIDIPIGLRDDGHARRCDVEARQLLGWPRMASVFPAPQRQLLACTTYADAAAVSRELFNTGISRQAFGIFRKVHDVDLAITPEFQQRMIEVHPEVSFSAMNDRQPLKHSKKTPAGFEERCTLLRQHVSASVPASRTEARVVAPYAGPDDLLDAFAVAWTARRFASGQAVRIPSQPEYDPRGLRMEIVY